MSASTTARTTRRRTLRVAAAALTAAAAFSLTACDDTDTAATGAGPAASGTASSSGAQGGNAQPGNGKSGSHTGPSRAGSGSGASKSGGKGTFCRTSDLVMEADNSSHGTDGEITVQMTNKGGGTCSATGFAGVDLKDADHTSAPIQRGGEQPRITDLKPGDTATFSISYTVDHSGSGLAKPTNIIVTPPNETHSVSLKWPADAQKLAGPYDDKIRVHPVGIAN
jgi:hypothetical protein